ncbi:MAG: NYN domain-containing protein, partial [Planctomycetota bacterium]
VVWRDRAGTRDNLARWLGRYCELQDCDVVLVFGGNRADEVLSPSERYGRVKVVNVPYAEETENEIAGPANRSAADGRTLVVTADYRLANALQHGGAKVQTPADFVASARKVLAGSEEAAADEPHEKFAGLSDEDVEFWLQYFSDES